MSHADDLPPPWAKHPEIPSGSIGWRMGYGEGWMIRWGEWLASQPKDRAWREAYLRRHAPAPRTWAQTVAYVLEPDRNDDDEDDDYDDGDDESEEHEALVAAGLVGDDVAMGAWEATQGEAPEAPWAMRWHGGKLGSAAPLGSSLSQSSTRTIAATALSWSSNTCQTEAFTIASSEIGALDAFRGGDAAPLKRRQTSRVPSRTCTRRALFITT